jgi:hypothetical protein
LMYWRVFHIVKIKMHVSVANGATHRAPKMSELMFIDNASRIRATHRRGDLSLLKCIL